MTTPQPEPRMPEQLEKLINEGVEAWRRQHDTATPAAEAWPAFMAAWLVSHGWGPRPTVGSDVINQALSLAASGKAATGLLRLTNALQEYGIEVTD